MGQTPPNPIPTNSGTRGTLYLRSGTNSHTFSHNSHTHSSTHSAILEMKPRLLPPSMAVRLSSTFSGLYGTRRCEEWKLSHYRSRLHVGAAFIRREKGVGRGEGC